MAVKVQNNVYYVCYVLPRKTMEEFEEFLQSLGDSLVTNGNRSIIIAGDFNAKHVTWGSRINNARGNILLDWLAQHNLVIINEGVEPTCVREIGQSVINLMFCSEDLAK